MILAQSFLHLSAITHDRRAQLALTIAVLYAVGVGVLVIASLGLALLVRRGLARRRP